MGRKSREKQYVRFCRKCISDAEKASASEIALADTILEDMLEKLTSEMMTNKEAGIDTDKVFKEHGDIVGSLVFVNLILANAPEKFRKKL